VADPARGATVSRDLGRQGCRDGRRRGHRIAAGSFEPGVRIERAATGGIAWAPFRDLADRVPAEARDRLAATLQGLAEGRVATGVVVDGVTASD